MPVRKNPSSAFTSVLTVPVIAGFDEKGNIIPLLIKLDNIKYDIISYYLKKSTATLREFAICIVMNNIRMTLSLTYFIPEEIWGIPREIKDSP